VADGEAGQHVDTGRIGGGDHGAVSIKQSAGANADPRCSVTGSFVQTMVLTDIATGWTECVPVVVRSGELVIEALAAAERLFPFPLRGVDFDNDSAFMNEPVVEWCRQQGWEVSRGDAHRIKTRTALAHVQIARHVRPV
jgi:hypothetical protein